MFLWDHFVSFLQWFPKLSVVQWLWLQVFKPLLVYYPEVWQTQQQSFSDPALNLRALYRHTRWFHLPVGLLFLAFWQFSTHEQRFGTAHQNASPSLWQRLALVWFEHHGFPGGTSVSCLTHCRDPGLGPNDRAPSHPDTPWGRSCRWRLGAHPAHNDTFFRSLLEDDREPIYFINL